MPAAKETKGAFAFSGELICIVVAGSHKYRGNRFNNCGKSGRLELDLGSVVRVADTYQHSYPITSWRPATISRSS